MMIRDVSTCIVRAISLSLALLVLAGPGTPTLKAEPTKAPQKTRDSTEPPAWTAAFKRDLEKKCQEPGKDGKSCFDVSIGGRVAELVPVADVTEAEKAQFLAGWNGILQPEYFPKGPPAIVTWRKLQLTKVTWGPGKAVGETRGWGPPQVDWICAKWDVDGKPIVAINKTITFRFEGPNRLRYRHPTQEEVGTKANTYVVETQIDKPELLNFLITVFQVPWQELTDFLVRWSLAAPSPNSLRIRSARFNQEADPPDWREWFDDFSFEISGDDPQYLSFGFLAPPKR